MFTCQTKAADFAVNYLNNTVALWEPFLFLENLKNGEGTTETTQISDMDAEGSLGIFLTKDGGWTGWKQDSQFKQKRQTLRVKRSWSLGLTEESSLGSQELELTNVLKTIWETADGEAASLRCTGGE